MGRAPNHSCCKARANRGAKEGGADLRCATELGQKQAHKAQLTPSEGRRALLRFVSCVASAMVCTPESIPQQRGRGVGRSSRLLLLD